MSSLENFSFQSPPAVLIFLSLCSFEIVEHEDISLNRHSPSTDPLEISQDNSVTPSWHMFTPITFESGSGKDQKKIRLVKGIPI